MKKISFILLAVFCQPGAFAQPPIAYDEDLYVFSTLPLPTSSEQEYFDNIDNCNTLIEATGLGGGTISIEPGTADIAVKAMLQSIHTKKTNGSVKKPIKEIGEMLVCQDWTGVTAANNFIPSFYNVTLDGMSFVAEGGGFSPVFGQLPGGGEIMALNSGGLFYPAENVFLVNYNATILPSLPGGPGGTMTFNGVVNFAGNPQFESGSIGVIRFFNPIID